MALIGIDLGTTFSVIAKLTGNIVEVLPNEEGSLLTPSIVYVPDGNLDNAVAGEVASSMLDTREQHNVVRWTKRLMGTNQRLNLRKNNGETVEFTPTQIASLTLRKLKNDAQTIIGELIEGAVITVPAWFGVKQCEEVMNAAKLAGIEVLQLLPEPQSATIDYAINQNIDLDGKKIFVYDLGGGTFDAILIEVRCQIKDNAPQAYTFVEIAKEGSRELGGYDWDKELIRYVCEQFDQRHDVDSRLDSNHDLEIEAEKVKKALSKVDRTFFNINVENISDSMEVTREKFAELTAALVEQTRTKVQQTLANAKHSWDQVDYLLLVGGSSNMPMVQKMLANELGEENKHKICTHKGVDFNVARGAAYVAGDFIRITPETQVQKENNEDIAQEVGEEFVQLSNIVVKRKLKAQDAIGVTGIKGNTMVNAVILPAGSFTDEEHRRSFPLAQDDMTEVTIVINRGESENLEKVEQDKGQVVLRGLPAGRPAGCLVSITLKLDNNGMLSGTAKDVETTTQCEIAISLNPIS